MKYFDGLVELSKLLAEEKTYEVKKLEELLTNKSIHERKTLGKCLFPLKMSDNSYGLGGNLEITFDLDAELDNYRFNVGGVVSIFYSEDNIKSNHVLSATIRNVKKGKLVLLTNSDEYPDELDKGRIGIDLTVDDRTYKVMEHTLNVLINSEDNHQKSVLKKMWGDERLDDLILKEKFESPKLNEWQNAAVTASMHSKDFTIIHGPPGTGKTTTLVQCVKQAVKREGRTLVTASSNAAVDHLVKCMMKEGLDVVRIGNIARVDEEVQKAQIDLKIQEKPDYKFIKDLKKRAKDARKKAEKYKRSFNAEDRENRKMWYKESRDLIQDARKTEKYLIQKTIESAQVIATTLIGSDSEVLREFKFKTAFIDEAAQALIPAALTPFKRAEKLVLAGDPFQLPPLVKNDQVAKKGLSTSLLELIMNKTIGRTQKLKTQYRMDKSIMAFSNSQFYKNELEAHPSVKEHGFKSDGFMPVEFIDTAGCGYNETFSKSGKSLRNEKEAELIKERLGELSQYIDGLSLGIISPYRGQVNYLKDSLPEFENNINTIDAFQGQERDVIIVSLVRSNDELIIGFLKDYRRMNVAMTRARKKLILIGDSATVGADRFFSEFLDFVEKSGSYRTAWEYPSF